MRARIFSAMGVATSGGGDRDELEPITTAALPNWDFLDAETGQQMTVTARFESIDATVVGRDVVVRGEGCDERLSLDAKAP